MGAELLHALPAPQAPQPALLVCPGAEAYGALRAAADPARRAALDGVPKLLLGAEAGAQPPPGTRAVVRVPLGPATLYEAIAACLGVAAPERPLLDEGGTQAAGAGRHRRGARVLVAEDNEVNRAVAGALLDGLGLRVAFAANGQDAVAAVTGEPTDMVLMDLQMPVMDGLEATRRLRAAGYRGPIVACTANVLPEALAAARAAGADRVLRKPIDRGELLDLLADALPAADPAAPPAGASPPMPARRPSVRSGALAELVEAIGPEAVREAAGLFRHSAQERVAGTLQALAAGDLAAASRHAHALKSPAAMLGAEALAEAMATIERAALSRDRAGAEAAAATLATLMDTSLGELDEALADAA
jgi:CheY-like chemotaxis protein/HPt (histidine-containing phosphotransfer) domain-containing protein